MVENMVINEKDEKTLVLKAFHIREAENRGKPKKVDDESFVYVYCIGCDALAKTIPRTEYKTPDPANSLSWPTSTELLCVECKKMYDKGWACFE